jgi:nicotinamidase-related amidase
MTYEPGIWDASECALLLMDYQPEVIGTIFEQDRRQIELNVRSLADLATRFDVPVVLSTVSVRAGVNSPTIASLKEQLPDNDEIDRTTTNAWEDEAFLAAVKATGRTKLVIAGLVTSVCLAYPVVCALAHGYQVTFVEDAVGDLTKQIHDTAVLRMIQAGGVPNSTSAMMIEWFRDWADPRGAAMREVLIPWSQEWATLKKAPEVSYDWVFPGARTSASITGVD